MNINSATKVLLVDDLKLFRTMLRKALSELNITKVDEATNGLEALKRLNEAHSNKEPYDLVFLDWDMPEKTGIEVLKDCRSHEAFANIPIIMVTAEAEKSHVMAALTQGANEYIVKPCSVDTLKKKIEQLNKKLSGSTRRTA